MVYLPVSRMSESKSFFEFVVSIAINARCFIQIYNKAILEQIQANPHNTIRTIKLLKNEDKDKSFELPFWLVSSSGQRYSLQITIGKGNNIKFGTNSTVLGEIDSSNRDEKARQLENAMAKHNYHLRPKAITLTLFARLYLANWFIHGVGGGSYETITDFIIERYYKINKPHFGVATGSMVLPLESYSDYIPSTSAQLKSQLRKLKFNPEKFIIKTLRGKKSIQLLIEKKKKLIKTANNINLSVKERKVAWESISELNKELLKHTGQQLRILNIESELIQKYKRHKEVINYRKSFFGLFSEQELRNFINL